jgi:PPM family protein phosphatase
VLGSDSIMQSAKVNESANLPAAMTDIGCEREINEDRYAVIEGPAGQAWIVCDGMGGTLGGELAAQLAVDAMRRSLQATSGTEPEMALTSAIQEANRVIVLRRQNPAFSSMGTTVVGAIICGDEITLAHAGDSRAYLVRGDEIQQLTVDHTYVQDLVDKGLISHEESMSHPQAHVLTKCLGAEPRLEMDRQTYWIWETAAEEQTDKLVLCSDGLYSLISDEEIAEIVNSNPPQEACAKMVEMARDRGGYDNITVAIVPLDGRLDNQPPAKRRGHSHAKSAVMSGFDDDEPFHWGTKLVIFGAIGVIGFVSAIVYFLYQMISSD